MANYCSVDEAAELTGKPTSNVTQFWLDSIDSMIEQYTSQGYKSATKTYSHRAKGNTLIHLPSKAVSVTQVLENGDVLPSSEYTLEDSGRLLERAATSVNWLTPWLSGVWCNGYKYKITYVEPPLSDMPMQYKLCAAECAAHVAMHVAKRKEYGIALTAADSGQAGKVATSASTSFPASLPDDLRRIIKDLLPRGSIY